MKSIILFSMIRKNKHGATNTNISRCDLKSESFIKVDEKSMNLIGG